MSQDSETTQTRKTVDDRVRGVVEAALKRKGITFGGGVGGTVIALLGLWLGPDSLEAVKQIKSHADDVPALIERLGEVRAGLTNNFASIQSAAVRHVELDKEVAKLQETVLRQNQSILDRLTKQDASLTKQWEIQSALRQTIAEQRVEIEILKVKAELK